MGEEAELPTNIGRITAEDIERAAVRVHARMAREARPKRRDRIHDIDPWLFAIHTLWLTGWGGWFIGRGESDWWIGLIMFALAALSGWFAVWSLRWRWKADIAWRDIQ